MQKTAASFSRLYSFNLAYLGFTFQEAEQLGGQVRQHTCDMSQSPETDLWGDVTLGSSCSHVAVTTSVWHLTRNPNFPCLNCSDYVESLGGCYIISLLAESFQFKSSALRFKSWFFVCWQLRSPIFGQRCCNNSRLCLPHPVLPAPLRHVTVAAFHYACSASSKSNIYSVIPFCLFAFFSFFFFETILNHECSWVIVATWCNTHFLHFFLN